MVKNVKNNVVMFDVSIDNGDKMLVRICDWWLSQMIPSVNILLPNTNIMILINQLLICQCSCCIFVYRESIPNVFRQGIIQKKYGHIGFWPSQKQFQLGVWGDALVKV